MLNQRKGFIKSIAITLFLVGFHCSLQALENTPFFYKPTNSAHSASSSQQFYFASYFHLHYTFMQNDPNNKIDNHWSLRRFKLIANWKPNNRLQFYTQFIYKTNNYSSTADRLYLQHAFIKLFFIANLNKGFTTSSIALQVRGE
jgi:hypothetical protein